MPDYFNTNALHGPALQRAKRRARSEQERVMDYMLHFMPQGMTWRDVWTRIMESNPDKRPNAGRVLTSMMNKGLLEIAPTKRDGLNVYRLRPKGPVQTELNL